jgi:hypothetical protein
MPQFANYVEQQPTNSASWWPEKRHSALEEQPSAKKRPKAVGEGGDLLQSMPSPQCVEALDEVYVWDDRPTVLRFIEENHIRGLLLDARQALDNAFGHDAIKRLSLVRDDEGFDTLFCLVRTRAQLEIATLALRQFDEHWWLARSQEAAGKMNFDFDLV